MSLTLTNTLTRKPEQFHPLEAGVVRMYNCGPTVKEPPHIGKFRSYLLADVLRRYLEYGGLEVRQVMNITDVGHLNEFEEDIVEVAAARTGMYAWELIQREERAFHDDRRSLRILDAHHYPRAHEHIDDMIALIEALERKGLTYKAAGNLYFDISQAERVGELSGKSQEELEALVEQSQTRSHPEKRHPLDIDLWRTDAVHQRHWQSPWGRGFPGWHVECAAMSRKYLGEGLDIHTGADDNIFPHHECERVQFEAVTGRPQARYWVHSAEVLVDGQSMSLKKRNVVTVRELLHAGFRGSVLRAALLCEHYRQPLDFGDAALDWARDRVNTVLGFAEFLQSSPAEAGGADPAWIAEIDARFVKALDDDLNYAAALSSVVEGIDALDPDSVESPGRALDALQRWDRVLGLLD